MPDSRLEVKTIEMVMLLALSLGHTIRNGVKDVLLLQIPALQTWKVSHCWVIQTTQALVLQSCAILPLCMHRYHRDHMQMFSQFRLEG